MLYTAVTSAQEVQHPGDARPIYTSAASDPPHSSTEPPSRQLDYTVCILLVVYCFAEIIWLKLMVLAEHRLEWRRFRRSQIPTVENMVRNARQLQQITRLRMLIQLARARRNSAPSARNASSHVRDAPVQRVWILPTSH